MRMLSDYNYNNLDKLLVSCRENIMFKNVCICDLESAVIAKKMPFLTIRCDVEYDAENAYIFSRRLQECNIFATFHFRSDTAYDNYYMLKIQEGGHEVGLHNNFLDQAKGDYEKAKKLFIESVHKFRMDGIKLKTVSAHSELFLSGKTYKKNSDLFLTFPELLDECQVKDSIGIYEKINKKSVNYTGDYFHRISRLVSDVIKHPQETNLHIVLHPHRWRDKKSKTLYLISKDILRAFFNGLSSPSNTVKIINNKIHS
jgi:hypothetical protein